MVKTVLKIDGMSCSMCEAHMNEVIRNNFKVNKVSSSASAGETVIISDAELDIPWVKKQVKDIGYKVLSYKSEPYEKKEKKIGNLLAPKVETLIEMSSKEIFIKQKELNRNLTEIEKNKIFDDCYSKI